MVWLINEFMVIEGNIDCDKKNFRELYSFTDFVLCD